MTVATQIYKSSIGLPSKCIPSFTHSSLLISTTCHSFPTERNALLLLKYQKVSSKALASPPALNLHSSLPYMVDLQTQVSTQGMTTSLLGHLCTLEKGQYCSSFCRPCRDNNDFALLLVSSVVKGRLLYPFGIFCSSFTHLEIHYDTCDMYNQV